MHQKAQGGNDKRLDLKAILVGVGVAHSLQAVGLRDDTLYIYLISVKVNLVGPFMLYFKLLMKANLALMIILVIVEANL